MCTNKDIAKIFWSLLRSDPRTLEHQKLEKRNHRVVWCFAWVVMFLLTLFFVFCNLSLDLIVCLSCLTPELHQ